MSNTETNLSGWRNIRSPEQAIRLIDMGVILKWRDMRTLHRTMKEEEEITVLRHFAVRLAERCQNRLQAEILVESMMIWLASAANEKLLHAFLEELFKQPGFDEAAWALVEIALTNEVVENTHDEEIFEMAVALVCELGIAIFEYNNQYPGELGRAQAMLDHIATYLLSVSNANSACIRLSLLHYFGVTEHTLGSHPSFSRIMSRFGHTILDHLFALLFRKRSEAVALQYLTENLPYVLEADRHSQRILHETFKHYMLKQPERFSLFIQAFTAEMAGRGQEADWEEGIKVYIQHLATLLRIASDVNHRVLGREFMTAIMKFRGLRFAEPIIDQVRNEPDIRKNFRELMDQLMAQGPESTTVVEAAAQFRSSKRGRRPSFAKLESLGTIHQITYLGGIEVQKAS